MVKDKNLDEQVQEEMPITETVAESPEPVAPIEPTEVTEEPEEPETTSTLIPLLQKYYPGEEITEENKDEMATTVIGKLSGIQDNLIEIADTYPEFAMFLNDVLKGMSPEESAARNFEDMMSPPEGSPEWENINKGRSERMAMMGEKKSKIEQLDKNKQVSIENATKFIEKTGLNEEDAIKFLDWTDKLNTDLLDGLISDVHFDALYKAYTFDDKIAEVQTQTADEIEAARTAGRNEQITQRKLNAETGDGIPKLTSGGKTALPKKPSFSSNYLKGVV
jgi:hypothetical protein